MYIYIYIYIFFPFKGIYKFLSSDSLCSSHWHWAWPDDLLYPVEWGWEWPMEVRRGFQGHQARFLLPQDWPIANRAFPFTPDPALGKPRGAAPQPS